MNAREARALAEVMLEAARRAGALVAEIHDAPDREISYKVGDDPVTRADREANALLVDALERACPGVPVVAEESDPETYGGYRAADAAFFVDPLDGTREFVAKNGEYCVMVGLALDGRAALGAIACPSWGEAYVGACVEGGFAERALASGAREPIRVAATSELGEARVLVSRSHRSAATDAILARLGARELRPYGSAGLKALLVANGRFDLYAHPGPTGMLWDTCAPEALVRAAGGLLTDARGAPIDYRRATLQNADGVVAAGPVLHALALARLGGPA